jgi:hypothetical protein
MSKPGKTLAERFKEMFAADPRNQPVDATRPSGVPPRPFHGTPAPPPPRDDRADALRYVVEQAAAARSAGKGPLAYDAELNLMRAQLAATERSRDEERRIHDVARKLVADDPYLAAIMKHRAQSTRPGVYLDIETNPVRQPSGGMRQRAEHVLQMIEMVKAGVVTQVEMAAEMDRLMRVDMARSVYFDTDMTPEQFAKQAAELAALSLEDKIGTMPLHTTITGIAAPPSPAEMRDAVDVFEAAAADLESDQ